LAGPKQTHCVPFSLILPTHCITRLDFLYIHNCYDYYYYYYYYYYMVALVIREKNYMAFANFIYAHTYIRIYVRLMSFDYNGNSILNVLSSGWPARYVHLNSNLNVLYRKPIINGVEYFILNQQIFFIVDFYRELLYCSKYCIRYHKYYITATFG